MDLLSVVTLTCALPAHSLRAGARGTIVEILDAETALVEFAGMQCVPVPLDQLEIAWSPEPQPLRAFAADLTDLLTELLRWQQLPTLRTPGGRYSLDAQRRALQARLDRDPDLSAAATDTAWLSAIWRQATVAAPRPTELPTDCPWPLSQILQLGWFPE